MNRDVQDLAKQAQAAGWRVEQTRNGHLRFLGPNGQIVICSGTPSDCRSVKNTRAQLRRGGCAVQ